MKSYEEMIENAEKKIESLLENAKTPKSIEEIEKLEEYISWCEREILENSNK